MTTAPEVIAISSDSESDEEIACCVGCSATGKDVIPCDGCQDYTCDECSYTETNEDSIDYGSRICDSCFDNIQ